jgi:tetratricopeptide (TPR) repeat protein
MPVRSVLLTLALPAVLCLGAATDDAVTTWQRAVAADPHSLSAQNQLASAYLQKMRETADGMWLDKASKLVERMLAQDPAGYDAKRRQIEIELFRHDFSSVVKHSRELAAARPGDPDNWGTLGDAFMEMGSYDDAAAAYQEMVARRHSLASYNRVAFYRFVTGDPEGAVQIMEKAVDLGGNADEHVAWCLTDLGNMYFKTGNIARAEASYRRALLKFPNYPRWTRSAAGLPRHARRGDCLAGARAGDRSIARIRVGPRSA